MDRGRITRLTRPLNLPGAWPGVRVFCVPLGKNMRSISAPRKGCEESSTPYQGAVPVFAYIPGVRKNAYAWLISQHASGVRIERDIDVHRAILHKCSIQLLGL
jgi:hypothetical protein